LRLPELDGATRVLAETILDPRHTGELSGLNQVLNILSAVGQISDNRAEPIVRNIAVRLLEYVEPILATRGDFRSRAILLDAVRKTFGQLATVNPRNVAWQTGFCAALSKIGDILATQGNLVEALTAYRHSRDIAEHLVKAGLGDAVWEHDLSTSQDKIGDILVAQGNLAEALASYRRDLEIAEHLARSDPGNALLSAVDEQDVGLHSDMGAAGFRPPNTLAVLKAERLGAGAKAQGIPHVIWKSTPTRDS
jgi:tetratricopeptide (TPR) repeat protein